MSVQQWDLVQTILDKYNLNIDYPNICYPVTTLFKNYEMVSNCSSPIKSSETVYIVCYIPWGRFDKHLTILQFYSETNMIL